MSATHSSESTSTKCAPSTSLSQENILKEILEEIFLKLPPDQVVCKCRLVCRQWKEVIDSETLWKERCRRGGYHLRHAYKIPRDWRSFYFLCKKRRNLLKNPRGEQGLNGWQILGNGGGRWDVHDIRVPHPDESVQKNFVASCFLSRKKQLIDLEKEGYNPSFMDQFQPDIKISDWYASQWDFGSEYEICVELLNQRKQPIQTFSPATIYLNDQIWHPMTHILQDYGPGVRYISFVHGGKTQFLALRDGICVTDSCVEICPAMKSSSSSEGFI